MIHGIMGPVLKEFGGKGSHTKNRKFTNGFLQVDREDWLDGIGWLRIDWPFRPFPALLNGFIWVFSNSDPPKNDQTCRVFFLLANFWFERSYWIESSLCSQELEHPSVFRTTPNRGIHRWSWTLTYPMGTGHGRRYRYKKGGNWTASMATIWLMDIQLMTCFSFFSISAIFAWHYFSKYVFMRWYFHSDSRFEFKSLWMSFTSSRKSR